MTEYELRQKAADMARSYIGCKESDGSFKPIIDLYNQISPLPRGYRMKYTDPWCAAFVSIVSANCGFLEIMPPECACDPMIALYKQLGRWEENDAYNAEVGDLIFYDWQDTGIGDNTGSSDHVGIVVGVQGTRLEIVEGNYSDAVQIRYIKKNSRYIRGFGTPAYSVLSDDNPEIPVDDGDDNTVDTYKVELPLLTYGNKGKPVMSAQALLIANGYKCGWWGDDGDFGDGTLKAVKRFQSDSGLDPDGEIGGLTWSALLGV